MADVFSFNFLQTDKMLLRLKTFNAAMDRQDKDRTIFCSLYFQELFIVGRNGPLKFQVNVSSNHFITEIEHTSPVTLPDRPLRFNINSVCALAEQAAAPDQKDPTITVKVSNDIGPGANINTVSWRKSAVILQCPSLPDTHNSL